MLKRRCCTHCSLPHNSCKVFSFNWRNVGLRGNTLGIFHHVLKSNFSQLPGQENVKDTDIAIAATLSPLSAKGIKPVLQPEEKSKVEETCETLKAKQQAETSKTLLEVVDEALQPKKVQEEPLKKSLIERITHEVKHYANGFKLLFVNVRISLKQLWKVLNGQELSRRERKLVRSYVLKLVDLASWKGTLKP